MRNKEGQRGRTDVGRGGRRDVEEGGTRRDAEHEKMKNKKIASLASLGLVSMFIGYSFSLRYLFSIFICVFTISIVSLYLCYFCIIIGKFKNSNSIFYIRIEFLYYLVK